MLYLVATPIGNLNDFSYRAIETLNNVDLIACENTRHSKKLILHYKIKTSTTLLNSHNESKKVSFLIKQMSQGKKIALISDAGTPVISDPGALLVKESYHHQIKVIPIPGPCAVSCAVSALGVNKYIFHSFLSNKKSKRYSYLKNLLPNNFFHVFFESPKRILLFIADINFIFGDIKIGIAREISKIHEEISWQNIKYWQEYFQKKPIKGEFVLILPPILKQELDDKKMEEILISLMNPLSAKASVTFASQYLSLPKKKLYNLAKILNI